MSYKCSKVECNKQATNILSFRNIDNEFRCTTDPMEYARCEDHIGTEDDKFYYPTIEEYTALRAMYEL